MQYVSSLQGHGDGRRGRWPGEERLQGPSLTWSHIGILYTVTPSTGKERSMCIVKMTPFYGMHLRAGHYFNHVNFFLKKMKLISSD